MIQFVAHRSNLTNTAIPGSKGSSDLRIRDTSSLITLAKSIIEDTTKDKDKKQLEMEVIGRSVLNYANLNIYWPGNWYRRAEILDARSCYLCVKTIAQLAGAFLPNF